MLGSACRERCPGLSAGTPPGGRALEAARGCFRAPRSTRGRYGTCSPGSRYVIARRRRVLAPCRSARPQRAPGRGLGSGGPPVPRGRPGGRHASKQHVRSSTLAPCIGFHMRGARLVGRRKAGESVPLPSSSSSPRRDGQGAGANSGACEVGLSASASTRAPSSSRLLASGPRTAGRGAGPTLRGTPGS